MIFSSSGHDGSFQKKKKKIYHNHQKLCTIREWDSDVPSSSIRNCFNVHGLHWMTIFSIRCWGFLPFLFIWKWGHHCFRPPATPVVSFPLEWLVTLSKADTLGKVLFRQRKWTIQNRSFYQIIHRSQKSLKVGCILIESKMIISFFAAVQCPFIYIGNCPLPSLTELAGPALTDFLSLKALRIISSFLV